MKRIILLSALILSFIFISCKKEGTTTPQLPVTKGVYIVNEGNFGRNNSTLSYYVPDSDRVYNNVFYLVNGRELGDTGNDILISGNRAYIVVNNSDKIEIIETMTHRSVGTILIPGASPYKIAIRGTRGYVTNLWRNAVTVVDILANAVVIDTIKVGNNPTGIFAYSDKIYVANSGFGSDKTVSVINALTNKVEKKLTLGDGPDAFAFDTKRNLLWVLCTGSYGDWQNPNDDTDGKLYAINVSTDAVVDSVTIGGHPSRLAIFEDFAYTIKNGNIVRINLATKEKNENFIQGNFYSFGLDAVNRLLYCADAKDYVQNGEVFVYDLTGKFLKKFQVGVIPGSFGFVY